MDNTPEPMWKRFCFWKSSDEGKPYVSYPRPSNAPGYWSGIFDGIIATICLSVLIAGGIFLFIIINGMRAIR